MRVAVQAADQALRTIGAALGPADARGPDRLRAFAARERQRVRRRQRRRAQRHVGRAGRERRRESQQGEEEHEGAHAAPSGCLGVGGRIAPVPAAGYAARRMVHRRGRNFRRCRLIATVA